MTKDHNIQIIMADHKYRFTSGHRLRAAMFQNSFTLIMVGGSWSLLMVGWSLSDICRFGENGKWWQQEEKVSLIHCWCAAQASAQASAAQASASSQTNSITDATSQAIWASASLISKWVTAGPPPPPRPRHGGSQSWCCCWSQPWCWRRCWCWCSRPWTRSRRWSGSLLRFPGGGKR